MYSEMDVGNDRAKRNLLICSSTIDVGRAFFGSSKVVSGTFLQMRKSFNTLIFTKPFTEGEWKRSKHISPIIPSACEL